MEKPYPQKYPQRPDRVYVFGTCLMDALYPDAGIAAIRLIQKQGVTVVFPPDQSCCGQPAYNSGFPDEARAVARHQIKIFYKPYPIVVPSGSCAGMLRRHYPALFEGQPEEKQARGFSGRVFELTEFLIHVLKIRPVDRGEPVKITFHSSCHASREMEVTEGCKALLRRLEHVELVELDREQECCGFGGTFSVKQPEISAAMVEDKILDILKTGAKEVISTDCGCLMNITGAMDKRGLAVKGRHIAEFLWERLYG